MVSTTDKNSGNTVLKQTEETSTEVAPKRERKLTVMKLQWVAERARKCERIKQELAAGTYHVDSKAVARKMLNLDLADESEGQE